MAKVIRTSAAKVDLADIWSYIAADNPSAADRLLTQIDAAFNLISQNPEIGFSVEAVEPGVRCKPVKRNYLVFYRLSNNDVLILRVLHAAREYEKLL